MSHPMMPGALRQCFETLGAIFPRHGQGTPEAFRVYLAALDGVDPGALEHATANLVKSSKFFPKPSELRLACLAVQGRYTGNHPAAAEDHTPRWDWRHDSPCPNCGARPRVYETPCATPLCRYPTGAKGSHVHRAYDGPDCHCWDGVNTGERRARFVRDSAALPVDVFAASPPDEAPAAVPEEEVAA